ncbi:MAG TPA: S-methyl-5-thioribose-1-phosphate isomerase [Longimicrobiales bacterium]|nr:S-methyl-5-thioribose-1-phosphate isomerase [Longimicrobiales bacterium]
MSLTLPQTLRWSADGRAVELLDQTLLPSQETYVRLETSAQVVEAIRTLRVRGAPAIGVAAAMGVALDAARHTRASRDEFMSVLDAACRELRSARPTAVNLAWAVDRMRRLAEDLGDADAGTVACKLYGEATAILEKDQAMCRRMGEHGAALLPDHEPVRVLTICNAGALATAGIGTALAPVYHAVGQGRSVSVHACETRPLLQGSRITAWELERAGVPCTVVIDSAAPLLLRDGAVDIVFTGADRIAANGDVANKVGTYSLAVHATQAGVPFYVVAPSSTLDAATATGADIEIEHRHPDEVRRGFGQQTAPADVAVYAPAFDVTPASLITGIVTDRGVLRPPYRIES